VEYTDTEELIAERGLQLSQLKKERKEREMISFLDPVLFVIKEDIEH
jgi:hypothetical protein